MFLCDSDVSFTKLSKIMKLNEFHQQKFQFNLFSGN